MRPLALIALSLSLVACGGHQEQSVAPRELAWIHEISVWLHNFEADVRNAEALRAGVLGGDPGDRARYRGAVDELAKCAGRFDADVGDAPLARLASGARMLRRACVSVTRGERSSLRSFAADPGDALVAASAALDHGADLLLRGRKRLEAAFVWNGPLPRVGGENGRSRVEPLFSRTASTLALRPIEVRCWSTHDWKGVSREFRAYQSVAFEPSGFVGDIDSARVNLAPWICAHLVDLAYAHRVRRGEGGLEAADAVNTLAHEAEHVIGQNGSEAETECYALQDLRRVARLLGASAPYADELAARQWREAYPREPPEYTTPLCRDGGPLDANPESSRWP